MPKLSEIVGDEDYYLSSVSYSLVMVMPRSRRVKQEYIPEVQSAPYRNGFDSQKAIAEYLGISLATVNKYFNSRPVDSYYFREITNCLGLDWLEIADFPVVKSPSKKDIEVIFYQEEEENFIYVERPPVEDSCYKTLLNPGALVRIKAPSLMGKTALIKRTFSKIKHKGYKTVYINLHLAETADFEDLEQFLKWFCISVGQALGLENRLADYWHEEFSTSKVNCQNYFESYLLAKIESPLVLCLDEVERIFPYQEVAAEFLTLLRAWHEEAKVRESWKRLRLLIAHSTEVYIRLDINSSPFNVGLPIELPEFSQEQVQQLAQLHEVNLTESKVKQLMDLVNGHPYLVEQTLSHLKTYRETSLKEILQKAATEAGIYRNHLLHLLRLLRKRPELSEMYKKVIAATSPIRLGSFQAYKLHSMGLVHLQENNVTPRCNLYQQYFIERLD